METIYQRVAVWTLLSLLAFWSNRPAIGDGAKTTKLLRVLLAEAMATIEGSQHTVRVRLIGGLDAPHLYDLRPNDRPALPWYKPPYMKETLAHVGQTAG